MSDLPTVRMCMFSGASSLPILIAEERGFFAAHGLDVDITLTRNSDELMQGLLDGAFHVVHAAPDNFVAWRDRTGAEILAWIGGTSGPLRLLADPSVQRPRDLAGRDIAVDAVASGFVSVLRKMLRADEVADDAVELVPLGSTQMRFEALREGRTTATMLTLPWSLLAADEGFRVVADQHDVLPRLQGSSAASLLPWLEANPQTADSYLRAIVTALTWLHAPGNHPEANRFLAEHYGIEPRHADEVRREITDPVRGWPPSGFVDPVGIELVCELRRENGMPPELDPADYHTYEPYRRVFGFGVG